MTHTDPDDSKQQPSLSANRVSLENLFAQNQIDLRRGVLFDQPPGPMPGTMEFDRVEGMLLGLAIGDALGNTSEGMLPRVRQRVHGEITDYLPNRYARNHPVGLPSDDTQMAFWTLEQLIADGRLDPEALADRFAHNRIIGMGQTVRKFQGRRRWWNLPWYRCGVKSAGNGALMRIAPVLLPHLSTGSADLWIDVVTAAIITHNDSASTAACLAYVSMLWQLLQMGTAPAPQWWLDQYLLVARELEIDDSYQPKAILFETYRGTLWQYVSERVSDAWTRQMDALSACNAWCSGAYLFETMPSALYILMNHAHDPEEAIIRAVNDTKDNDTLAAIVGAAVGALHGRRALPERWIEALLGRTSTNDDSHVFELLSQARQLWWPDATERP